MAKKTNSRGTGRRSAPATLAELTADPHNPRQIADRAKEKLRGSLAAFGDISGIVFNRQTGELVCGHQRVARIRARWPEAELAIDEAGRGYLVADGAVRSRVRVVEWDRARQRAANLTANNAKLEGEFTEEAAAFLAEVHDELDEELPSIAERVRLLDFLTPEGVDCGDQPVQAVFQVIAYCDGEEKQLQLREELDRRGYRATAVCG